MAELSLSVLPAPTFRLDGGAIFGVVPKALWEKDYPVDAQNRLDLTTRTLLLSHGERHIVVDPGIGLCWDAKFTERFGIASSPVSQDASLRAAGLSRKQITDVFLTHLHFDHLGGCFQRNGDALELSFPHARHHVQDAHWAWAQAPSEKDAGSFTSEHLQQLDKSGALELHSGGFELLPGVTAFTVEGHTRGQQLLRMESGVGTFVYGGDLFPLAAILKLPWVMAYDIEPLETLAAKKQVLRDHFRQGERLILGHERQCVGGTLDFSGRYVELVERIEAEDSLQVLA